MKSVLRKSIVSLLMGLLSVAIVLAQSATCPELVETALNAVENNCTDLGRNELCYGYNLVQASFINEVPEDFFSQVSDRSPVAELVTLQTFAMNSENGQWGVALMNLQANLPNTIPGQNVTFVLMGDVSLENAVAPENAFSPVDGIAISLAVDSANLRSGAGLNFNVIAGLGRGESIIADGLSEDGEWLRVVKDERPAWLNRSLVSENPEIANLPVLRSDVYTPMQAFYLRTGLGQPECLEAPEDMLLVQGPEDIQVQITVNGAQVALGSSGIFRTIEEDGASFLEITVLDGIFDVDGTEIRTGQRSRLCLGDENSRGMDGESNDLVVTCEPSRPENVPNFGADWCKMETIPSAVLNYGIAIRCPGETPAPENSNTATGSSVSQVLEVDCSNFSILTSDIPATDFTLSWTEALGADNYEIAVYDSGGFQVSSSNTSATSIGLNGGASFSPSGYVDVRAYRAGVYACYTRLNFTRSVDPNASNPAVATTGVSISCSYDGLNWYYTVSWSNIVAPLTIIYSGPASGNLNFGSTSGSHSDVISDPIGIPPLVIDVTTGDGGVYTKNC